MGEEGNKAGFQELSCAPQMTEPEQKQSKLLSNIQTALDGNEIERAITLARDGLSQVPSHPLLLHLRAQGLANEGRYSEALQDLQNAWRLAPQEPRIPNGIGECLIQAENFIDAVGAFDEALRLWPEFPLAHYNRGFALENLREYKLAQEAYHRAASLAPRYADPLGRLAALSVARADWLAARAFSHRALAVEPAHGNANLAAARVDMAEGNPEAAQQRLDLILSDGSKDLLERASAMKQLADIRHSQRRFAEAFAFYTEANGQLRVIYKDRLKVERTPVVLARVEHYLEQLVPSGGGTPVPGELSGAGRLAFVAGFPRSGTTLLGQVLAAHRDAMTLDERSTLLETDRAFLSSSEALKRLSYATEAELQPYREAYWKRVRSLGLHVRDKVIVDKQPMQALLMPAIARLFPQAKVLFALRDPRDVVLSTFRRSFVIYGPTFEFLDLFSAAHLYDGMMRVRELCRAKLGLAWHDIRHEDLVAHFQLQMQAVCDFLGLPWLPSLHRFAERAKRQNIATPSAAQIVRGLNAEGVGQWRNYREQLAPVLPILQPWVEKFGYPAE